MRRASQVPGSTQRSRARGAVAKASTRFSATLNVTRDRLKNTPKAKLRAATERSEAKEPNRGSTTKPADTDPRMEPTAFAA